MKKRKTRSDKNTLRPVNEMVKMMRQVVAAMKSQEWDVNLNDPMFAAYGNALRVRDWLTARDGRRKMRGERIGGRTTAGNLDKPRRRNGAK